MPKIQEKLSTNYNVGTPWEVFWKQTAGYDVLLDVCADAESTKAPEWYTEEQDGLAQDWAGDLARLHEAQAAFSPQPPAFWMNPPYGRLIGDWVEKAVKECWKGATGITLLPARPGPKWFGWIWSYSAQRPRRWVKELRFLPGRIQFENQPTGAMFPSMVVVLGMDRKFTPSVWPGERFLVNKAGYGPHSPAVCLGFSGDRIQFRYEDSTVTGYVLRRGYPNTWKTYFSPPWSGADG